jgi:hypothetical protein
LLASSGSSHE